MARRRARELAFRALFQAARGDVPLLNAWADLRADLTEQTPDEAEEVYGEPLGADGLEFAERLVRAFAENQSELDGQLAGALEGWTFAQMSQTDLAVLRLALTELTFENLPPEVTFEVAVRIAKRYGGEESGRFVNGVLARLHRDRQGSGGWGGGAENGAGQNSDLQDGEVQDGGVKTDAREKGEVQNLEAPAQTHDLTAEDSTSATTDVQAEDVSAPSDAEAQPDFENPGLENRELEDPEFENAKFENAKPENPDAGAADVKDPDPEDSGPEDDLGNLKARGRDVVGR